ncbi:hypothetical protein EV182_006119 [Spiromyces aspiralis]|uniref:Uncharacterized protein n=1 Tax=Spiromyces aspiralis TaxID=68401 RepID=A0ACC1HSZ3_9FUNG|nr:hypothetical protein EV182_006119 [Spiromyces aspiralis]
MKVSSALRTITPWSTYIGPRVTVVRQDILSKSPYPDALVIAGELASVISRNKDFDIAKHLSAIVREDAESLVKSRNEKTLLCAALTERDATGQYVEKLFEAFIPPIVNHGFAFEAHPQNSLVRIDADTHVVTGFVARDFGGIKVHRPTFKASTGKDIDMLPDSCTDAQSMYEVYDLAFHTLIQCHLHRLVRALDLHYNGQGWGIVRGAFCRYVPARDPLHKAWWQDKFDLKCFIRMKVDGLYRDYIYNKVPNMLHYRGEQQGVAVATVDQDPADNLE